MFRTDGSRETETPFADSARAAARGMAPGLRALANEHSRAQRAAGMAERHHARPAEMRALYLATERTMSLRSIATLGTDEATVKARRIAGGLRAAVLIAVLGLIALILSTG